MTIISEVPNEFNTRNDLFSNMLRSTTMLEKAIGRVMRSNFLNISQYPDVYTEIISTIGSVRCWIQEYKAFSGIPSFYTSVAQFIVQLSDDIKDLWDSCKPKPGKKAVDKPYKKRQKINLTRSINEMLAHVSGYLSKASDEENTIGTQLNINIEYNFIVSVVTKFNEKIIKRITSRGGKTAIFPCATQEEYNDLISEKKIQKSGC